MSQSARSSPMAKTRGTSVPEVVALDEIGRATEAAFSRVSSARSRLEAQRRAKSMPNTPVTLARADDGVSASARNRGRVDADATRLDFLKMIDEEERTQEEVAEDAKLESANPSSSSDATASVRPPMSEVKEEMSTASSKCDSPAREPEVVQLIEAAMEKCKVLQVEELDRDASVKETRDVEPRAREEAVAIGSVTNSPAPPPKSEPQDAGRRTQSPKPVSKQSGGDVSAAHESFKAPESYRNSRDASAAAAAQRTGNATQESECVIM